ncbi:MAG: putative toxin-antitoxin system toxin component, PIN family [Rhodoferax ferrireducens]|uniref:Putative toxin-antitoxin system toxin component, PIN family n=1 Tax=Rhodoferax ferrireducens TaxID=192843 RepID=A0A1W9KS86_9BURK|nr:MAG: putative toxin-antitoxin system toxin component, PIN family [Rhodoferax ferrireducens]
MRVVLDTNVVLSALVFGGGLPGRLRRAWQKRALWPLADTATVQELIRVLAYPKFRLSQADQSELLADYLPHTQTVAMPPQLPPVPECRDPYDLMFMRLAVAGRAQVLVSGDKDLLALAEPFKAQADCQILSVSAFFQMYPKF